MNKPTFEQEAAEKGLLNFDVRNLRRWLHRIEETTNQDTSALGRAINGAALEALRRNVKAPMTFGLPLGDEPIGVALPPLSLGRDEAAEILDNLRAVDKAMQALPFRDYLGPSRQLTDAIETIEAAFPGGFAERCLFCQRAMGIEETVTDENGEAACRECAEAHYKAEAIELAQRQARGEWIDWTGGDCPVDPETIVDARLSDSYGVKGVAASSLRWDCIGEAGDVVSYRIPLPALAPVTFTNHREPGEFGEGATVGIKPEPLVNWHSAAEAAQAIIDGYLPPGYRTEGLTLIVPDLPVVRRYRGHSTAFAMFDDVRRESGEVLKTKHGGGHE